jgi:SAM-dependent methyltransferase
MEPSGEGSLGNMQISLGSSKYLRYLTGGFRVGDGVSKRAMREGVQISCYGTIGNRTARTLQVYERQAELFLSQWGRHRCRVPPLLRVLLKGMPKGSRLLDMGCGPAQDTLYLSARGYRSIGLDATWAFLRWAREKSPSAPLVQADLRRLPFTPGRFDAVWSAASLIHLSKAEVRRVLVALYGIVTSGGRLAATLAHGTFSGVASHGWLPGRYISRWTKADLARVVTRAGWRIELLTTVSNQERKGRWLNLLARRPL